MNTEMLKRARELWSVDYMSHYENRANMRKWEGGACGQRQWELAFVEKGGEGK